MLTKKNVVIALVLLTVISPTMAKVYKWTDVNGKTHYTATPPPAKIKVKESEELKINKTPKSSLTFKPKYSAPIETTYKEKRTTRKIKKSIVRKKRKSAKNKDCTNTNLSERKAFMRDIEKNGKKLLANGRETQESYNSTLKMFRRAVIDCE